MSKPMDGENLQHLLIGLCDGELTPAQRDRLVEILRESAEARSRYARHIMLHARLVREMELFVAESAALAQQPKAIQPTALLFPTTAPDTIADGQDAGKPASPILGFLGDVGRQSWGFLADHTLLFSILALLVVAGILALGRAKKEPEIAKRPSESSNSQPENPGPSVPFARLVGAKDCRWNGSASVPQVGQMLNAGQSLSLASGVAEIDFAIGAKVILQSPATLQLLSAKSTRLEMGKATVEIKTDAARGFKILTPEATFIDQGTEFGVEVTPGGNSKIHVFRGRVDIDQKARAGQAAPRTQRLDENAGARMEGGEGGMTLVQDTGECFIRSMDEVGRDQHVVAYWRFEDRPVGTLLPHTALNTRHVCATVDSSFNGNDLYTNRPMTQPIFSAGVAAATVPQTGIANRCCLDTSQPVTQIEHARGVYTHSEFSHAAPWDLQKIAPAQWTIEASVKAARLIGKAQGFLGRDADFTQTPARAPARLVFQINARERFAIGFCDADGRFHEAVAEDLAVEAGRWYHLAATSDGRALRLYADVMDGRGYVERAATELPAAGSTALGKGHDDAEWTVGRAGNAGDPSDWPRFYGWIDEVRISDIARDPAELLFAPKEQKRGTTADH